MTQGHYGKYRGEVVSTFDPDQIGQIRVRFTVGGNAIENWALPCVPYAGGRNGFLAIPPVGAGVWVEFEEGNLDHPIWSGCWWKKGELGGALDGIPLPALPVVLQSTGQHRVILGSGAGDAVVIETVRREQGPRIVVTDSSVKISCGPMSSIEITDSEVKINDDALVVR